jgi:hypothetical protein
MRIVLWLVLVLSCSGWADVGKIALVEGVATRSPKGGGVAVKLTSGSSVELGDRLEVSTGNLKFELNDGSVIVLAPKSSLEITEAEFEGQERSAFSGFLKAGSLWTRVKKALGGGKFEVSTERAVAGVRGTIFRIDADTMIKAAKGSNHRASVVRVAEGTVAVKPTKKIAATMKSAGNTKSAKPSARVQVAGPKEISADEWEAKFVELQKNQQLIVGVDLWEQAQVDEAAQRDDFARWIDSHP